MSDDEARVRARLREFADGIEPSRDLPAAGRARYRHRVRRRRASAAVAGALVVIAATGVGIEVARGPSHPLGVATANHSSTSGAVTRPTATIPSTTNFPTTTIGGPVVSPTPLADTSWISADDGWALVKSSLLHTVDGGVTWRRVSTPPATVFVPTNGAPGGIDCGGRACVSHVRFADARHGYLFGRSLLTTDDGGSTWTTENSATVLALEVAHGRAFRVVTDGGCFPPGCAYFVETARVGSSTWQRLSTPAVNGDRVQLLYDAPRIYVAVYGNPAGGGPAEIQLLRSLDSGVTWEVRPDPCGAALAGSAEEVDTESLAAAPGGFLVALCQPRLHDRGLYTTTSFDAGSTFGAARRLPLSSGAFAQAIAAGAPTTIAVAALDGASQVVAVSHDQGATWRTTLHTAVARSGESGVAFLGFENADTGRVAFTGEPLWRTRDAGETWAVPGCC